ncbi:MAG: hypothetical protein HN981_02975 [Candidatus Pacebacteria bacterium]|nr:hypothetical protein [Candidatus Paceibacterota bacterium]MBT6756374.1 hypothetical protein [Candidatus Paceibacterota bacterium]MBT6921331.1 hypothetical protein [Candidatus Paceibacterota bacterium]
MKNKDLFKIDDLELIDILYYPNLDFKISEQTVFVTLKVKTTFNKRNNQYLYQGQPLLVGDHHIFKIGSTVIPGVIHNINTSFFEPKTQKILVEGTLENEDNEEIERDAEVRFVGVKNYFIDGVNSGSIIKNNKGKVIAEIIRIDKSAGYKEFIYNNSLIKIIDPERKQANILLELDVSKVNNHYFYRREDKIVLGKKIPLSFDNFNIYFKIEKILD